jgi:hypothetical protein
LLSARISTPDTGGVQAKVGIRLLQVGYVQLGGLTGAIGEVVVDIYRMRLPSWTLLALCLTLAVAVTVVAFQETETWSAMSQSAEAAVTSVHSQTDLSYNGGPGGTQWISVTALCQVPRAHRVPRPGQRAPASSPARRSCTSIQSVSGIVVAARTCRRCDCQPGCRDRRCGAGRFR